MFIENSKRPLASSGGMPYRKKSSAIVDALTGLLLPRLPYKPRRNSYNYEFPGDLAYIRYQGGSK